MRLGTILMALLVVLLGAAPVAAQEKRIALLIGNQAYDTSVGALKNPHNDIALVGDALTRQGFELLPLVKDARRAAILTAVRDLVRRLNAAGAGAIGFIYYSGHGAAEKDTNINYLIPVDAKEPGSTIFWDESLKLDDILKLLDGARGAAKFIVFDACRNELQLPTKDTSKGLMPVAEQQGMFIAYASAPGKTASDRGARSGPYAAALAAELAKSGLDHLNLFQNVKETVLASTGGVQQPWESNGLGRRVYLTGPPQAAPAAAPPPPTQPPMSEAAQAWVATKDTTSIAVLEAFERQYSTSAFAGMARARIGELQRQQTAIVADPSRKTNPRAEAGRGPFDGAWRLERSSAACKTTSLTVVLSINGGRIATSSSLGRGSGSVSSEGGFSFLVTMPDGGTGQYSGRVSGNKGSGSYVGKAPGVQDCYGSFSLNKV
ncbi:MAG: caspase family protein [Hyphomicrobiaceae bacterium]